jgi:hypothetical protein
VAVMESPTLGRALNSASAWSRPLEVSDIGRMVWLSYLTGMPWEGCFVMAQRVITQLVSDLSGGEIADGRGETIELSYRGANYSIDLTDKEAAGFDKARHVSRARHEDWWASEECERRLEERLQRQGSPGLGEGAGHRRA